MVGGKGRGAEVCGGMEGERYRGVWWEGRGEVQRCVVGGKGRGRGVWWEGRGEVEVCGGREGER